MFWTVVEMVLYSSVASPRFSPIVKLIGGAFDRVADCMQFGRLGIISCTHGSVRLYVTLSLRQSDGSW